MTSALIVHTFSCWFMTGAIWLVQILVYPNFKLIGKTEFQKCHQFHTNRITWIVAPLMTIELSSGIWMALKSTSQPLYWNVFSILLVWILTATVNVPAHNRLLFDLDYSKNKLVLGNWPRTVIWTARSLFWIWFFIESTNGSIQ